ncbi:MAG: GyrI-like domain-containing protein [Flavobacteriaceae bacterium]|nr:MAG: GyrI-like domain-containing protein [Flavobacteriaceae bacterium]
MIPRIETIPEKKLIGMSCSMSINNNKTAALWGGFMPRKNEVENIIVKELYAMQIYQSHIFKDFTPETIFEQWACVAVTDFDAIPTGMEKAVVPAGLYAVFVHKGLPSDFPKTMDYITKTWMPKSKYTWDIRPHFQVMGQKYKNNDPDSEEEVWVAIKSI